MWMLVMPSYMNKYNMLFIFNLNYFSEAVTPYFDPSLQSLKFQGMFTISPEQ